MLKSWSQKLSRMVATPKEPNIQSPLSRMRFHIGYLDNVEDREFYRPGGYHPTRLGDSFQNGRYKIIHKLGYGGFATVWLARDKKLKAYVALKIIAAEVSQDCKELEIFRFVEKLPASVESPGRVHVVKLIDNFWIEGPNGRHLCLVLPSLGPSITHVIKNSKEKRLSSITARKVAFQATQALAFLHSNNLGHGDFRPSNLLFGLVDISKWSASLIKERFGEIEEEAIRYPDATPVHERGVPDTIISPADCLALTPEYLEKSVYLVDLGESFLLSTPPANGLGTPASYCAPELYFDKAASKQTDIWALACTIFEIRSGYQLFETFMGGYEEEVVDQIVTCLGNLPEPWLSRWSGRRDQEEIDIVTLEAAIKEIGQDTELDEAERGDGLLCQEEVDDLADLLRRMLKYDPAERIGVDEVLKHRWFLTDYKDKW